MKRGGVVFVGAALVALAACSGKSPTSITTSTPNPMTSAPAASANVDLKTEATTVVDDLAAGKFNSVEARFDDTMKAGLSVDALATDWVAYQKTYGGYRSHGTATEVLKGQIHVERVPITTANGTGEVRVSYHPDGTIAGLFFLKAGAPPP